MIVSASSQEGVLEDDEKELLYNVFDLSDTVVRAIMTPRVDMVMIDATCSLRDFLTLITEHGYSRVPVYEDRADDIRGVAHTSDVLAHLGDLDGKSVLDIMRPTFFTPESMRVSELLKAMREKKTHMAIVVDEFGGTAGLVTLEDVLEEIVGEIYDETDEEAESLVTVLSEGRVSARRVAVGGRGRADAGRGPRRRRGSGFRNPGRLRDAALRVHSRVGREFRIRGLGVQRGRGGSAPSDENSGGPRADERTAARCGCGCGIE
jgi:CBS domain-containing protein